MFGIFFINHTDLRRILTDYGFNGYPLRKDFPLNGFLEIRYDESKQYLVYEEIELMQNLRFYDFLNPIQKKYLI
jgi:NADH-quinone oxidoreductase subunit C